MKDVPLIDGLLDLDGAAKYLKITPRALRDFCRSKAITHIRVDYRNYRFRISDLDALLEARTYRAKGVYVL